MGKSEKHNVMVFVIAGVLLAGGVGLGVWQVGSPAAPATTDTATTSALSTTRTGADPAASADTGDSLEINPSDEVIAEAPPSMREDPFLAPNAVLPSAPAHSAPTTTYRPDNAVPLSPDRRGRLAAPSDAGASGDEPSARPEPVTPTSAVEPLEPLEPQPETIDPVPPTTAEPDVLPDTEDPTPMSPTPESTPEPSPEPEPTLTAPGTTDQPGPEDSEDTGDVERPLEQDQDAGTPYPTPQDEPGTVPPAESAEEPAEPTEPVTQEPAQATAGGSGSGPRISPMQRAASWFRH